ncbi:MAG: OsmC family protein [Candidatus Aminicenantes bacterium]|nr:OsmC family protein [Candidatus Aminicenantes bacterium]
MADNEMHVTFPGGVRVDAAYHGFTIHTDQPVRDGGEGSAPSPFSLFLASLATCAGYYVISFCRSRNIPTDGIELTMTTQWDAKGKMISLASIEISLPPDFPEKYAPAVVRAADQCTVKAHLQFPPDIETKAVIRKG